MSKHKYVWPDIFRDQLRELFVLDANGYIKYPQNIDEVLNIIEDAIRAYPEAPTSESISGGSEEPLPSHNQKEAGE